MNTVISSLIFTLLLAGSAIKPDEQVIFFNTWAYQASKDNTWVIPIHGWVFEPERGSLTREAALEVFEEALELDEMPLNNLLFQRHAAWFLVDNERGEHIRVRIGDRDFAAGESQANGHFSTTVMLADEFVAPLAETDLHGRRWLNFTAVMAEGDVRQFRGKVELVNGQGTTVISDIDDTIRITEVRDKDLAFARTFLQPFEPAPGMAKLYSAWAHSGVSFHYVSSSPWQLYPLLTVFMKGQRFPEATFDLREFRPKDISIMKLFADTKEMKLEKIEPMMNRLPHRRFILVGDSGEKDPEVYGELARRYPDRILHVLIRNVTEEAPDNHRFQQAFKGVPRHHWQLFTQGEDLMKTPIPNPPATSSASD